MNFLNHIGNVQTVICLIKNLVNTQSFLKYENCVAVSVQLAIPLSADELQELENLLVEFFHTFEPTGGTVEVGQFSKGLTPTTSRYVDAGLHIQNMMELHMFTIVVKYSWPKGE